MVRANLAGELGSGWTATKPVIADGKIILEVITPRLAASKLYFDSVLPREGNPHCDTYR